MKLLLLQRSSGISSNSSSNGVRTENIVKEKLGKAHQKRSNLKSRDIPTIMTWMRCLPS